MSDELKFTEEIVFPEGFADSLELAIPNAADIDAALNDGYAGGVEAALALVRRAVKECRDGGELRFARMQQLEADIAKLANF
jgi:hypothetical protein